MTTNRLRKIAKLLCPLILVLFSIVTAAAAPPVYVLLWFDTEDYILPEADDAALELAEFLTSEGVRATFKIVGEKARVLDQRGRRDVLSALSKHEIGYHTNFHSVQPSPAMYLSQLGWFEGVREFERRETQGLRDLERITGQKAHCYGQPGSSWGPQQYGGLRNWGVPVYLDAGSHISLDGDPFWYGGILTIYDIRHTLRTDLSSPEQVTEARLEFGKAYDELQAEGGGLVSIYYHPCEFVHAEFWDGVNFRYGANPPRSEWKLPPMKSPAEIRTAFSNFKDYIRTIKSHSNVQFITASRALELYPDRARDRSFSVEQLRQLARGLSSSGVTHQQIEDLSIAPSEQLLLLGKLVGDRLAGRDRPMVLLDGTPIGPVQAAPEHGTVWVSRSQFERTLEDVASYLSQNHGVPDVIWLGGSAVSPESFLMTLADVALLLLKGTALPEKIKFEPATLESAKYVQNGPELWGWVIFPPGFEAPEMMELARRQAWTLKPALLSAR